MKDERSKRQLRNLIGKWRRRAYARTVISSHGDLTPLNLYISDFIVFHFSTIYRNSAVAHLCLIPCICRKPSQVQDGIFIKWYFFFFFFSRDFKQWFHRSLFSNSLERPTSAVNDFKKYLMQLLDFTIGQGDCCFPFSVISWPYTMALSEKEDCLEDTTSDNHLPFSTTIVKDIDGCKYFCNSYVP